MAATGDAMNEKLTFRRYKDGDDAPPRWTEQIFQASWSHKCPTYIHRTPPCQGSCPSGEDIRGWLNIARGIEKPPADVTWQEYAFRRSTDANPFPSTMGRVCPAPCETGCNRNKLDDRVGINSVEQFIGDHALSQGYGFEPGPDTGKKIAIIGGGPAGLAAAYQLRRRGHGCTLFDEHEALGGMMRYGIPSYRTPRDVLDGEIKRITDMGVEVRLNTRVGRDVSMDDVEREFDAVLWAIGAQAGRALPIDGADAPNCVTGVAFLEAFNQGRLKHVSGPVLVVGGGDTSIDVACVARRLGVGRGVQRPEEIIAGDGTQDAAKKREDVKVILISRQSRERMNASDHEVADALNEGVEIRNLLSPVEVVLGDDGQAKALRVVELEADGKTPKPGSEFDIEADLIASAIGQTGEFDGYESLDNGKGLMESDRHGQLPGKAGHFVAGDVIKPHLLTTAIGQAYIAVEGIERYLKGEELGRRPKVDVRRFELDKKLHEAGLDLGEYGHDQVRGTSDADFAVHNYEDRSDREVIDADELFLGHFEFKPRNVRDHKAVAAKNVLGNFDERIVALTEELVVAEAKRCMSCGMCFECDNCVIYCPQEAVKKTPKSKSTMGRYVFTDYDRCIGCHICKDVCPTGYIDMGLGE